MPDTISLTDAILELVNYKKNSVFTADNNIPGITKEDVSEVLLALSDLNFKIIPNTVLTDDFRMQEAAEVIAAWLPEGLDYTDVNAAQIFMDLKHRGWLIVPPVK